MKTIFVNLENQTVEMNGNTCNFYEAGLTTNADPVTVLTDKEEILEVLEERHEGAEIVFA